MIDHSVDTASIHAWTLANATDEWQDCGDALGVAIKWKEAGANYQLAVKSRSGASTNQDISTVTINGNTWYYLRITRSGTSLILDIYSNAARTTLVEQLSVVIQEDKPFTHVYAVQSNDVATPSDYISVDIANLDLGSGTEDYTTYTEVDPNSHIAVTASNLDVNMMNEGEIAYVYKIVHQEPSNGASFTGVQAHDKIFWKKVSWTSNVTAEHRVAYSLNPGMSGSSYSEWHNNTDSPEIYISSENLKPDTTYYYQAETWCQGTQTKDSIRSFTTTLTAGTYPTEWIQIDTVVDMLERSQCELYFHDGIYYLFSTGATGGGEPIGLYTSTNGIRFAYYGEIISSPPAGHESFKTPVALVVGSTFYLWVGIRWDDAGTNRWREGVWSGNSFTSLTYDGLALDNDEKPGLSRNCRLLDVWYNTTSSKYCTYVGGGSSTAGAWDVAYYAESSTTDFRGTLDANELYDIDDWVSGSWPDTFIYPPHGEWIGGKYLAWVTGCGDGSPPYGFDTDLFFIDSPRAVSKTNSYSGDASTAYATSFLGLSLPSKNGIASDTGDLSTVFTTYNGFDFTLFKMAGFWANNTVMIEDGYMPRFHYSVMPTESEFKAMLDVMIYVWDHTAQVTVRQVSGTAPTYAKWDVSGTNGDTIWVNIDDFTTDTVELYRNEIYVKDVSPVSGSDFLFTATLSGASPDIFTLETGVGGPTVTTQSATGVDWYDGTYHATLHGTITDIGGENCDERGFDWGYSSGSYPYDWTEVGSYGVGAFDHYISGLTGDTVYFRAKSHNSGGWGYGGELSFQKPEPGNNPPNAPTLNTPAADSRWDMWEYVSFTWTFSDPDGGDTQSAYQLQLDDTSDFSSPLINTGKVSSSSSSHNGYIPNTIGLFYWRVKTWDNHDLDGNYSLGRIIITDRILVYDISSDDSRRDIGTTATLTVHLHHEYDGSDITTGSFTLMGLALTHQSGGDWTTTHSRSTSEAITFNSVSGSTGNLDEVNMNGKTTTVIWDRIHATATQSSDPRVNVNANVDIDWTLKYDYDETAVTDGTVTIEGETATHQGAGVWRITTSESTTQAVIYDEFTASGGVYDITEVEADGHSETAIWDRWKLTAFWASSYKPQTGTNVTLFAEGELEYDGHPPNGDDNLEIENIQFTWDWAQERFEVTVSKETNGSITYNDLTNVWENTHGINVGTMNGLSVTVEWGNYTYQYTFYGLYSENGTRAGSVDLSSYVPSGTVIYELNGNLTEGFNEQPELFSWNLEGGGTRFIYTYKNNETLHIFTPDDTYSAYGFIIRDYAGIIVPKETWLEAWRPINGTEHLIERNLIRDTSTPVTLTLTQGKIYILRLRFKDGSSYTFGTFIPGADTSPTLSIYDIDSSEQLHYLGEDITIEFLRPYTEHIRINYEDTTEKTTSIFVEARLRNGTQVWNDTSTDTTKQFNWYSAVNTTDYLVNLVAQHTEYGEIYASCWLVGAKPTFDEPPDFDAMLGEGASTGFAVFLILAAFLLFSRATALLGIFFATAMTYVTIYLGFLDMPYTPVHVTMGLIVMWGLTGGSRK